MTRVYVLDGTEIKSLDDFWKEIGEAVNGPGGYFGRNLDSFHDCLRGGGFGTPADGNFCFEWQGHEVSRQHLGYEATVRELQVRLARCHESNRPMVLRELQTAEAGQGKTVFDWLVDIMYNMNPTILRLT
ncbi:hypothetical protein QQS21_007239 [Conoideocrella luteorostrata]|uniref:Barstar (barnase inhibitor) domain-containing protein n=1 Tax=Conoideocrella luteorostrata TaxID=1105319 RepID=A0AAJ0FX75_9HYPO|nr:hypothetical protein QQS21_007239 [Conoideocrella luteorostrata]